MLPLKVVVGSRDESHRHSARKRLTNSPGSDIHEEKRFQSDIKNQHRSSNGSEMDFKLCIIVFVWCSTLEPNEAGFSEQPTESNWIS